jgi:ribosomal protein L16/L10AE
MKKFWEYHAPVWAPPDEGSAGAGEGKGGEGGGAASGGEGEGAGGDSGGGEAEGQGEAGTSILDFATKAKPGDGDGEAWKVPEGVDLPDHLLGSTADETLAKVARAYQGARQSLSQKGKGKLEGTVPDDPDGYVFEPEGDDDKIAAELNSEYSQPYVDAFRKAAHKLGIPAETFTQFMRTGLAGIAESGMPIGVSNEEAAKISGEQEMAALVNEVGPKEANTIVNTISTYAEKLTQRGVLQNDAEVAEFAQMFGTAMAARIFHRMLTAEFGEKPIPMADGMDGSVTPEEAYAKHAAASRMPAGAEKDAAMVEAQRLMAKAFGTEQQKGGMIQSSVL